MSKSTQIRNQFINFFCERGHTHVPSAPVVPDDDHTLLFTNAGMNQFKDMFLEQGSRPYSRAVDSQKCIRVSGKHNDLDAVGLSPNHHTFFEMLGNWSFGDYYKYEAISWAWELLTKVWKIDPNRMYPTVFEGNDEVPQDEEAFNAWIEVTGLPKDRISFHGRKDNFWEMGDAGPCGPCSEVHYDLGPSFCRKQNEPGHQCEVNGDCGRIFELWNLVFIQYRRDESGNLHPLPRRHVDTGAGFERIVMVLEGGRSNYETSLFIPILETITQLSGVPYHPDVRGIPHRVAVDHVRSLSFSLADGVLPSNEGRGYVIRRILRRAARFGREIGLETPFLYKLVDPLVNVMDEAYPELKERYKHITGVIHTEEQSFARTLGRGLELFGQVIERLNKTDASVVPGKDAFKLYDTYGFPIDLTELMARERKLKVDTNEFNSLMTQQRERARGSEKFVASGDLGAGLRSKFVGYDTKETTAKILAVNSLNGQTEIVLDLTPFYAEAGGQISDWGVIETMTGRLLVTEVAKTGDIILHRGHWKGEHLPEIGSKAMARIDWRRRLPTMYNHTATHLFHTALRQHIGRHATQAGSLVAPDKLRFDFTHFEKLSTELVDRIEKTVNEAIRNNYPVITYQKSYREAIDSGVTALFGEKYGDVVRIVQIGKDDSPYSRELCGGTHIKHTGQIGLFRIVYEGAVSAGVRRIEAVTGEVALDLFQLERRDLQKIRNLIGSHGSDPVDKLAKILDEKKALEKEFKKMLIAWAEGVSKELIASAVLIDDVKVVSRNFDGLEIDRLKMIGDAIRDRYSSAVALLTSPSASGAGQLCCVVGDNLISNKQLKAGTLVGQAARIAGGGGGGRPHMATAGTRKPEKLSDAVKEFPRLVKEALH